MTLGLCNALVALFPWSPAYLDEYAKEKDLLQSLPGLDAARFEHIGSTAVPGLPAKPIIDILITVRTTADQAQAADALAGNAYSSLGECGRSGRLFFVRGPKACLTTHHIHLVLEASPYQKDHLTIRDALTADNPLAAEYADLKIRLASDYPMNRTLYRLCKGIFIEDRILHLRK
jgi:GrpB-like predicted nucleotidyltransferase (UPF0157 family)